MRLGAEALCAVASTAEVRERLQSSLLDCVFDRHPKDLDTALVAVQRQLKDGNQSLFAVTSTKRHYDRSNRPRLRAEVREIWHDDRGEWCVVSLRSGVAPSLDMVRYALDALLHLTRKDPLRNLGGLNRLRPIETTRTQGNAWIALQRCSRVAVLTKSCPTCGHKEWVRFQHPFEVIALVVGIGEQVYQVDWLVCMTEKRGELSLFGCG